MDWLWSCNALIVFQQHSINHQQVDIDMLLEPWICKFKSAHLNIRVYLSLIQTCGLLTGYIKLIVCGMPRSPARDETKCYHARHQWCVALGAVVTLLQETYELTSYNLVIGVRDDGGEFTGNRKICRWPTRPHRITVESNPNQSQNSTCDHFGYRGGFGYGSLDHGVRWTVHTGSLTKMWIVAYVMQVYTRRYRPFLGITCTIGINVGIWLCGI